MPVVRAFLGQYAFPTQMGPRVFVPEGEIKTLIDAGSVGHNPVEEEFTNWWAARLFIGGNVGDEPTWSPLDIEDAFLKEWSAVVEAMKSEGILPKSAGAGASVVAQRGVFHGGHPENSVQIVVINDLNLEPVVFQQAMVKVAEKLCVVLKQNRIYVDMQLNGLSQRLLSVRA